MKHKKKIGTVAAAGIAVALALKLAVQGLPPDAPVAVVPVAPVQAPVVAGEGSGSSSGSEQAHATVTLIRIVDGDTAHFLVDGEDVTVRFLRINTTEKGKPGYKEGTEALRALLTGKTLMLEYEVGGVKAKDRYGRDLAYVYADGVNVNVAMVRTGWTKFYVKYGKGKYKKLFEDAEKEAREAKRGLWQEGSGS